MFQNDIFRFYGTTNPCHQSSPFRGFVNVVVKNDVVISLNEGEDKTMYWTHEWQVLGCAHSQSVTQRKSDANLEKIHLEISLVPECQIASSGGKSVYEGIEDDIF